MGRPNDRACRAWQNARRGSARQTLSNFWISRHKSPAGLRKHDHKARRPPGAAIFRGNRYQDLNRQASNFAARRLNRQLPQGRYAPFLCARKSIPWRCGTSPSRTTILRYFSKTTYMAACTARRTRRQGVQAVAKLYRQLPCPQAAGLSQGVDSSRSTRKSSIERRIKGIWRRDA